jgi:transcriptional regulator with XRE-family HTH domain
MNIKARRSTLQISQEKLAELADISVQMVNCIERRRTWVSDKMLVKLAAALQVEAFELLCPSLADETGKKRPSATILDALRQDIKEDIDVRFDRLLGQERDG